MIEGIAIGHQGGGGENAVTVRLHDSFVHVAREAEIVRVENETGCVEAPFKTVPGEWS